MHVPITVLVFIYCLVHLTRQQTTECTVKGSFCNKRGQYDDAQAASDNKLPQRPMCSVNSTTVARMIGYYEPSVSSMREPFNEYYPCSSMQPEQVPYGRYTHVVFRFATIDPRTFKVSAGNSPDDIQRLAGTKRVHPNIKVWIAIGGWAFSDPGPTRTTFSSLAASTENTTTFLDSLVSMLTEYRLDGVEIDWEFPGVDDRGGRPEDYKNQVEFMSRLRSTLKNVQKGVSMAIPATYKYLKVFDVRSLEPYVDWFSLMSYDLHGSWDIIDKSTGPWANSHTNMTEIQLALDLLWRNDISPTKVTMAMSFHGRSFTLTDPNCHHLGCLVSSGGNPGQCSGTVGILHHGEIERIIQKNHLEPTLHPEHAVKTVSWGNQWVSYDDADTWRLKGNIARSQCINSFAVRALNNDNSNETDIQALSFALDHEPMRFPSSTADSQSKAWRRPAPQQCRWSSCFEGCPVGFKEVRHEGKQGIMMDKDICRDQYGSLGFARFCCPATEPLPTCAWRGHRSAGNCQPGCDAGEVEVGSRRSGCKKNHQSACCRASDTTTAYGECYWTDCHDNPEQTCNGKSLISSPLGWGGHQFCQNGQSRSLCCNDLPRAALGTHCKWVPKTGFLKNDGEGHICEGSCPQDSIKLSLVLGSHDVPGRNSTCYGYSAYCCTESGSSVKTLDDRFTSLGVENFRAEIKRWMECHQAQRD
ncbi:unnamed protein product [Clonostachys rosea]|uniref:chitinase n=1 Tax=Bionectria ochroleuca TaxID=29856 RepID=A0ABY6TRJ3_BIOOC|nr:unnamed protein product [Clonostachys rosea]